jgi:3-oxoacyl-[acyl-carrier protein] reductase
MTNKIALVTGVGRRQSIGSAITLALSREGWDVAFTYWEGTGGGTKPNTDAGDPIRLRDACRAHGYRAIAIPADLMDESASAVLYDTVHSELGAVSGLVLSHAAIKPASILTTEVESMNLHMAVNVRASWQLIADFARQLPGGTPGQIVALTSDHTAGNLPYGASKGALDRVVLAAAQELGSRGVTANLINPGPVDTGWMTSEDRREITARQPTGRLGTPEDAANLVSFLLSPKGRWITGQLIVSDGGYALG